MLSSVQQQSIREPTLEDFHKENAKKLVKFLCIIDAKKYTGKLTAGICSTHMLISQESAILV